MTKGHIYHFIFAFLISFGDAFAQNDNVYWQLKIIDLSTSAPLETANISINRKTDYPINTQGKLRLYKKTPNESFPKEELVEPMVVQNTKKKKWFSIDISHLAIKLPEDVFFIVFEVLGKEYYNDKKVKVFSTLADELPSFGFTTFPKDINKENYSIIKLDNKKWFLHSKNTEYQFQAKIVEIQ